MGLQLEEDSQTTTHTPELGSAFQRRGRALARIPNPSLKSLNLTLMPHPPPWKGGGVQSSFHKSSLIYKRECPLIHPCIRGVGAKRRGRFRVCIFCIRISFAYFACFAVLISPYFILSVYSASLSVVNSETSLCLFCIRISFACFAYFAVHPLRISRFSRIPISRNISSQPKHQQDEGFLGMHPVLRLIEDDFLVRLENFKGDFFPFVSGQVVHRDCVRLCVRHQL